jgi:hypothetical protein
MRRDDWESRLIDCILQAEKTKFEWGTNDCVTFAADVIQAITGGDPIDDLRGMWNSARTAQAKIKELGGLQAGISGRMGPPLDFPMLAGRGDLVLTDQGNIAVVVLNYAVALGKLGLVRYEPRRWITGWRVA